MDRDIPYKMTIFLTIYMHLRRSVHLAYIFPPSVSL